MAPPIRLRPLSYQSELLDFLKKDEADLWGWFSSQKFLEQYADNVRLEILKTAYRLDRQTHEALYVRADEVLAALGLALPVTLYQSQVNASINASLSFLPGEVHLIFSGPILTALTGDELKWVIGHELHHHVLLDGQGGEFLVADQILQAMAAHPSAAASQVESSRLFRLYAEVFADRGGLAVVPDPRLAISALVKLETGLAEVSADSYLRQAEEILSKDRSRSRESGHPELYIRARVIQLWSEQGEAADGEIARLLEGQGALDSMDLLGQKRWTEATRRALAGHLAPAWLRSEPVLAHARLFFADLAPADPAAPPPWPTMESADPSVQTFFAYLLLDFATVDPQLGEPALAASVLTSRRIGIEERFLGVAARELKLKKRRLAQLAANAEQIVARAEAAP